MRFPSARRRGSLVALLLCAALTTEGSVARGQAISELPFAPGERFEYAGRVRAGVSGRGTLWVEGPGELRGTTTWTLHSDMEGRLGFIRARDNNASWLDPVRFASLRYTSEERHLLARHDDVVDIFPAEQRWSAESGATGTSESLAPLDELSFLYYLRTLPLLDDTALSFSRHFDTTRNPTLVTVLGRAEIEVGAGRFRAVMVEMRVRDARRYKGEGIIRIALSDDRCRLLLRLESNVPDAGKATLSLVTYSGMRADCSALIR